MDELLDFHPKTWLSKYRQTSFLYLSKMGLFYSGLGLVLAFTVYGIQLVGFGYEEPILPVSLITAITAGPIEETLFFGIPFALSGNHFVMLGTGILWALTHLANAQLVGIEGALSYSNFAFTITHIFFSIRTWRSGKGWFTIFFHSVWNTVVVMLSMTLGDMPVMIYDPIFSGMMDVGFIIIAVILMAITYPLYKWRLKREAEKKSQLLL